MADDELDTLYSGPPEAFTARRTELAKAAKQRGDAEAAKRIIAARKPTAAAWLVNRLAIENQQARRSLAELGEDLREAHAAMDGDRIRELSAHQHRLIKDLTRAAFDAADIENPSGTQRDDVAGTLQAAVADVEVRARLGRLTTAERWSGFGEFGDATPVSPRAQTARTKKDQAPAKQPSSTKATQRDQPDKEAEAARRRRETLTEAVADAERAQQAAESIATERQAERDAAALRRDEASAALREAERELDGVEKRYQKAHQVSRTAADAVKQAKADLKRA